MNKPKGPTRIMVADDDPAILDSTQLLLEELGYEVQATVNGDTVRDMKDNLPDVLLLDIWMSGWDGREICRYLKSQPHTSHIPIIIISANRDVSAMAAEAGADGFINKPFDMNVLIETIERNLI